MDVVLREACDNCHRRKTRCPLNGDGPCDNCRKHGRACVFSPRSTMGRPRQQKASKKAAAAQDQDQDQPSSSHASAAAMPSHPQVPDGVFSVQQVQQGHQGHQGHQGPQAGEFHDPRGSPFVLSSMDGSVDGSSTASSRPSESPSFPAVWDYSQAAAAAAGSGPWDYAHAPAPAPGPAPGPGPWGQFAQHPSWAPQGSPLGPHSQSQPQPQSHSQQHHSQQQQRQSPVPVPAAGRTSSTPEDGRPSTSSSWARSTSRRRTPQRPLPNQVATTARDPGADTNTNTNTNTNNNNSINQAQSQRTTPQPKPHESAASRDDTETSLQIYSELSQVLFSIHSARDVFLRNKTSIGGSGDRKPLENILALVSSFCDMVAGLDKHVLVGAGDNPSSPCLLLVLSVVSTVVDLYQQSVEVFQAEDYADKASREKNPGTHTNLRVLVDATAMEFHLARLGRYLARFGADAACGHSTRRLDEVRVRLKTLINEAQQAQ